MAAESEIRIYSVLSSSQYWPQLLPAIRKGGPRTYTLVKIEIDQRAHATLSPRLRVSGVSAIKAGKRFRELFEGQTRTDNEIRGMEGEGWPAVFITPWSRGARTMRGETEEGVGEERERESGKEEGESERAVRLGRGTRRDVVQVDLWKVGGKREGGTLCVCVAGQPRFTVTGTNRWTNLT